jgi:acyl carrier protein
MISKPHAAAEARPPDQHTVSMVIVDLWREALQTAESPCSKDNFFALGGDSMAMVTLEFRIQEELGVPIPPGTLLTAPTLGELTAFVEKLSQ